MNIIWLGLFLVLIGTQIKAQNLDTTSIKNRQFLMLVESKLHKKEVVTMVESINIDKIQKFLTQIETTLENIKSFLVFSPKHKSCFSQANSFLDEISLVAPMIMSQNLNSVVLHHYELDNTNRFIIGLFRSGSHLVCKYSYSLVQINLLLSSNILRDGDNTALVANYLTQMSTMFSQNNNNCIRHGLSV